MYFIFKYIHIVFLEYIYAPVFNIWKLLNRYGRESVFKLKLFTADYRIFYNFYNLQKLCIPSGGCSTGSSGKFCGFYFNKNMNILFNITHILLLYDLFCNPFSSCKIQLKKAIRFIRNEITDVMFKRL